MKTGCLLRVRRTPSQVRTTDSLIMLRPFGGSNVLYEASAGEVFMYLGECSPKNYYKVLCPRGIGWIFWVDVDVVDGEHKHTSAQDVGDVDEAG